MLPRRPILTVITYPLPLRTTRMIITTAILRTIRPKPSQITFALVFRFTHTLSVMANVVTRAYTRSPSIPNVTLPTLTTERTIGVGAHRLRMAIVQTETTLVHIGTIVVGPTCVRYSQHFGAIHLRITEITLHTHPRHRVGCFVTPTATQRTQAIETSRVMRAILATLLRFRRIHVVVLNVNEWIRLIQPFPTQSKLILAGVDRETETLLGGFAPDTTALLLQTRAAILALVTGHGAVM